MMGAIVLVDTSVFLNILDVPGRNQDQQDVFETLMGMVDDEDHLLLPMAAIIETGRHIAHLDDGGQRRHYAKTFVEQVRQALEGTAPWKPTSFPKKETILTWLEIYPDHAMQGLSLTDLSIIKEWEKRCQMHPLSRVRIWALDDHLGGYDRQP